MITRKILLHLLLVGMLLGSAWSAFAAQPLCGQTKHGKKSYLQVTKTYFGFLEKNQYKNAFWCFSPVYRDVVLKGLMVSLVQNPNGQLQKHYARRLNRINASRFIVGVKHFDAFMRAYKDWSGIELLPQTKVLSHRKLTPATAEVDYNLSFRFQSRLYHAKGKIELTRVSRRWYVTSSRLLFKPKISSKEKYKLRAKQAILKMEIERQRTYEKLLIDKGDWESAREIQKKRVATERKLREYSKQETKAQ